MFRWSTKPESNHADHQWVVSTFRKRRAAIENASAAEQRAFQLTLALFWKGFIAQYGSPDGFAKLPRAIQMEYFKKLLRLQATLLEQKDFEKALPLEMLNIYLAAIISKCRDFKTEAATFLGHHSSQGHQMAALVNAAIGTNKKASATLASWWPTTDTAVGAARRVMTSASKSTRAEALGGPEPGCAHVGGAGTSRGWGCSIDVR